MRSRPCLGPRTPLANTKTRPTPREYTFRWPWHSDRSRFWVSLGVALLTLLAGCQSTHPAATYPLAGPAQTLADLRANLAKVTTISASGRLILRRPDGQSTTLDAALAARLPDDLRLRAWKFGQAVFDLTRTAQGLWLWSAPPPSADDHASAPPGPGTQATPVPRLSAADLGRGLDFLMHALPPAQGGDTLRQDGAALTIVRHTADGGQATFEVDRATRTLRGCRWSDPDGHTRYALRLSDYRDEHGIAWPRKITATGPAGTIDVLLDDVDLNSPIPAGAFNPPPRATRQP